MYQTIRLSSCVSVQGERVAVLTNGQVVVRVGGTEYRGQPIERQARSRVTLTDTSHAQACAQQQAL